jgi:phosphoesterase RecJ-like protein
VKFSTLDIEKLKSLLATPQKVVVVSHKNPDGDALGSSLGWLFFLQKLAHDVVFVSPNDFTKNLSWIPGTDLVLPYDNDTKRPTIQERIEKAEVIFCLDFNALSRVEELGERIKNASAIKVMIDHHQQPESFAALTFSDTSYCATAEMVHDIIVDLGYEELIDGKIALCLYTGLTTDSGFFQFNSTTPNALRVGASLVEKGARPEYVSEKVNNVFKEHRLRFFGYCLHEKLKLVNNGKVAYMMLSQAEIKKFNLQSGDSESLVNYPFKIETVQVAVYFSEDVDRIKISFRSRGEVDVNTFARKNFEGGGHTNAAGGKSLQTLDATEKKFLDLLPTLNLA